MNATKPATEAQPIKSPYALLMAEQRMGMNHPSYFKSAEREG